MNIKFNNKQIKTPFNFDEVVETPEEAKKRKKREYNKQWYKNNPEYFKQWRENNPEYFKECNKRWRENNPEYFKQYRIEHRDEHSEYNKQYCSTMTGRANNLRKGYDRSDKERGFDTSNNIDSDYIVERIFTSKCYYCGDDNWEHLGVDRIDNSKPHTPDNVICACGICNMERSDKFTVEEFKQYRTLHPRAIDIPKEPILNERGAIKKKIL